MLGGFNNRVNPNLQDGAVIQDTSSTSNSFDAVEDDDDQTRKTSKVNINQSSNTSAKPQPVATIQGPDGQIYTIFSQPARQNSKSQSNINVPPFIETRNQESTITQQLSSNENIGTINANVKPNQIENNQKNPFPINIPGLPPGIGPTWNHYQPWSSGGNVPIPNFPKIQIQGAQNQQSPGNNNNRQLTYFFISNQSNNPNSATTTTLFVPNPQKPAGEITSSEVKSRKDEGNTNSAFSTNNSNAPTPTQNTDDYFNNYPNNGNIQPQQQNIISSNSPFNPAYYQNYLNQVSANTMSNSNANNPFSTPFNNFVQYLQPNNNGGNGNVPKSASNLNTAIYENNDQETEAILQYIPAFGIVQPERGKLMAN